MTRQVLTRMGLMMTVALGLVACSDGGSSDGAGGAAGTSTGGTSTGGTSTGGTSTGGTTSSTGGSGGATGGTSGGGTSGAGGEPFVCSTVRDAALGPVDAVSNGEVTVLAETGDERRLYIDASAGGFQMAASNPAVYLDLATTTRVDITDIEAFDDDSWDVAIKRVSIRNNSGDGGPGAAAAAFMAGADFDAVTMAEASTAMLSDEDWFDDECGYPTDPTGALVTTMSEWYDYDPATMTLTPKEGVYVVRGADGTSFFKVSILEYYANPDGTPGMASGRYVLRVAPL